MPYLQQVPIDEAQGAVREAYDRDLFSKTLDAAGAQPDEAYASTEMLLDLFPAPQNP